MLGRRAVGTILAAALTGTVCAAAPVQRTYSSAEDAAAALVQAARADDQAALRAILGPGSKNLVNSGDRVADQQALRHFVDQYDQKHALAAEGPARMVLDVGPQDWPMPIPIVRQGTSWRFDAREGAQEIIDRRIGRNELAAIRVALTYVDAQHDYFERLKQATGTGAYAQRLVSRPDQHDGLYWPAAGNESESPLGPSVAQAQEEGYPGETVAGKPHPYQGYYFRILKAQGPDAAGGAKDYVQDGQMTGGFALIAWPASFGASGIMTFQVNQDDIVYQKDLGRDTASLAAAITRFDPDLSWARVDLAQQ
jgi:hypothetical protein